jgi:AcrR family transcriptional regulator
MGRKSLKDIRQKEIIEAFYNVAVIEGLENASISKVAKEMGANPSLILHYFNSKEDLIFGLINFILERYKSIFTTADSDKDPKKKLIHIINNLFSREWNTYIDDGVFYSCYALIFRNDKIKEAFKDVHLYLRQQLDQRILEAKNQNVIDIESPEETAELIFVIVEGAYYYLSFYYDKDNYQEKLQLYREAAFDLLNMDLE